MKKLIFKGLSSFVLGAVILFNLVSLPVNATYYTKIINSYPWSYQGNLPICWACVISSMDYYINNSTAPKEMIIGRRALLWPDENPSSALPVDHIKPLMEDIFPNHIINQFNAPLSEFSIMVLINNDKPVYIHGKYVNGSLVAGHSVALVGYKKMLEDNSIYRIYYMNPQHNGYNTQTGQLEQFPNYLESASYSEELGIYHFHSTSGFYTYTWEKSFTLT